MTIYFIFFTALLLVTANYKFIEFIKFNKFVSGYKTFKNNYNFFKCLKRTGTEDEISDYANLLRGYANCIIKSGKHFTEEKAVELTSDVELILSEL